MTYINIPLIDDQGQTITYLTYDTDTIAQIQEAREAMHLAGLNSAEVWTGEGPDAVRTGEVVFTTVEGEQ